MKARALGASLMLSLMLTTACAADGPRVRPSNIVNFQPLTAGTVVARRHYGAKSHWLQVRRAEGDRWGKVRRSTYWACTEGEAWPACRPHGSRR